VIALKADGTPVHTLPDGRLEPIDRLENRMHVYVVRIDQCKAYSTQQYQRDVHEANPFPEAAVDAIPLNDILADLEIKRKYFWDEGTISFYDFDMLSTKFLPSEESLRNRFGNGFPAQLRTKLQGLEQMAKHMYLAAKARYDRLHQPAAVPVAVIPAAAPTVICDKCGQPIRGNMVAVSAHRMGCKGRKIA
jgi:hypothetical protein